MRVAGTPAPNTRRPSRLAIDLPAALGLCGTLLRYLSLSSLFPAALALGYGEPFWPFLAAGAIAALVGTALERLGGGNLALVGSREGYLVVALTWLLAAGFGALPFLFSGDPQLDRPVDALFEAMSGFTTTGASVVVDVNTVDQSLLMWRQFTQWLGGMGIIVLALAVLPRLRVGGRQLLESELPGPEVDQLADRIRSTARRLWVLYVALTAAMAAILTLVGLSGLDPRMGLFEAVSTAFATLPAGGFMPDNRSLADFAAITQWIVVVFMALAGVNFALTYLAFVRRRPRRAFEDQELRLYFGLLAFASIVLVAELWTERLASGEAAVRHGVFQAVSIMTTTGFSSVDYSSWTTLAVMTLLGLMFVGGSAGSTSGSIKLVRHVVIAKMLRREIDQTVHPHRVAPLRVNTTVVDERALRAIIVFVFLYLGVLAAGATAVLVDSSLVGVDLSSYDALAAAATTLGGAGPGLGFAGPMGSFAPFSDLSTFVLTALMYLGRLEILPVLVIFTRSHWRA